MLHPSTPSPPHTLTPSHPAVEQVSEKVEEMTLNRDQQQAGPTAAAGTAMATPLVGTVDPTGDDSDSDSEPAVDIDDYVEEEDPGALPAAVVKPVGSKSDDDTILQTRTYDLNITYDNYYRTPRLWLFGYDESQRPLDENQMYEDVSQVRV